MFKFTYFIFYLLFIVRENVQSTGFQSTAICCFLCVCFFFNYEQYTGQMLFNSLVQPYMPYAWDPGVPLCWLIRVSLNELGLYT